MGNIFFPQVQRIHVIMDQSSILGKWLNWVHSSIMQKMLIINNYAIYSIKQLEFMLNV
jgi:hypothetical protein